MKRMKNNKIMIKIRKTVFALTIAVFLFSAGISYAGAGESGAAFLRIGVGAKPASMGEAYAGVNGDITSIYYNPAGLSSAEGYSFSFSHALWFEDINYSNFAAGMPLLEGYAALSFSGLMAGKIDKYNRLGDDMEESYSPKDMAFAAAWAGDLNGISLGGALKFITSEIDGDSASAFALDMGVQRKIGDINAGLSIQNLGTKMTFRDEGDPLPLVLRLGGSYPFSLGGFSMLAALDANISKDVPFKVNAGINADYPVKDFILSLRLGVKSYAEGLDALSHLTTGFGVEYSDVVFDYGFASFEDLGLTHRVSLGYRLN